MLNLCPKHRLTIKYSLKANKCNLQRQFNCYFKTANLGEFSFLIYFVKIRFDFLVYTLVYTLTIKLKLKKSFMKKSN